MVLELKEERETYLVAPALWESLFDECKPVCLFTAVTRQKVLSFGRLKCPVARDGPIHGQNPPFKRRKRR